MAGEFLSLVDASDLKHPYLQARNEKVGVVAISSDQGFLGGLNSQVIQRGLTEAGKDGFLTLIGERGSASLRDASRLSKAFPGITDNDESSMHVEVRDHVLNQILSGQCGKLMVVYPKPISLSVQRVTVEQLIPFKDWNESVVKANKAPRTLIWESKQVDIMSYVLTQWIGYRFKEIFGMSRLAEYGARVMHLEGSYQELLRQGKKLRLQYFRTRHELIDRSMREVFAAQLLFGKLQEEEMKKLMAQSQNMENGS